MIKKIVNRIREKLQSYEWWRKFRASFWFHGTLISIACLIALPIGWAVTVFVALVMLNTARESWWIVVSYINGKPVLPHVYDLISGITVPLPIVALAFLL